MLGNVWEWTQDCYEYYNEAPTNGSAWLERNGGNCSERVFRGGSWLNFPAYLRSAGRFWCDPDYRFNALGFRLAQDP